MKTKLLIAGIAAIFATSAFAQSTSAPNAPRVDKREANQAKRIEHGKTTGALTDKEAARLEKGQQLS